MSNYDASIKPIETRYKGYRFRSRLEARWAVFLDAMGVSWEYEPEGYLINGRPYLPDFALPDAILEIKHATYRLSRAELETLCGLAATRDVIVARGVPSLEPQADEPGQLMIFPREWNALPWSFNVGRLAECDCCGGLAYMTLNGGYHRPLCKPLVACGAEKWTTRTYKAAAEAARAARFEHGESPES